MRNLAGNIQCDSKSCQARVSEISCAPCGIQLRGSLTEAGNEFSRLEGDDLHFLRVFVHCEGRIREMERALGVSYPTVKGRLAELKQKLTITPEPAAPASEPATGTQTNPATALRTTGSALDALAELEQGNIDYQEALERIQKSHK